MPLIMISRTRVNSVVILAHVILIRDIYFLVSFQNLTDAEKELEAADENAKGMLSSQYVSAKVFCFESSSRCNVT